MLTGAVFSAEILNIDPDVLLPRDFKVMVRKARSRRVSDSRAEALRRVLNRKPWQIPGREVWESRFHIIPPDKLFLKLSDFLPGHPAVAPSMGRRLRDGLMRYSDDAYQLMRWDEYVRKNGTSGKKGQKIPKGVTKGWRWDISKDIRLVLRGVQQLDVSYGFDSINQNLKEGTHVRRVGVTRGFRLAQNLNINLVGRIGNRVKIGISHNSQRKENQYEIGYTGRPGEVIKEIKAGNIDLKIPNSKYVVYSGGSKSAFGLKAVVGSKDSKKFKMEAILSLTKGVSETKTFTGQQSQQTVTLRETAYVKHKYYTLPHSLVDASSLRVYKTTTVTNNSTYIAGGVYTLLVAGTDYSFSTSTSKLDLVKAVTKDQNLLVTYTVSGGVPDFSSQVYVDEGATRYLVLKSVTSFSKYERKGVYNIGYRNIDTTRGFEFYIINTADSSRSEEVQFSSDKYHLDTSSGLLEFYSKEPFTGKAGITDVLYDSVVDPTSSDSVYSLKMIFLHKVDSFQLRFNVLPGSERVLVNNVLKTSGTDYKINYTTGVLTFITVINENDTIKVSYEYKPYSSSLQRTLLGIRADFNPVPGVNVGGTLMYSGGQKPTGAPTPNSAPTSSLIFDLDATIDFISLFGIKNKHWKAQMSGEFAYSIQNRNTVGKALFADMEGDTLGYAITRSEDYWKLGSPSLAISNSSFQPLEQTARGRLYYRDYRDYSTVGSDYTLKSYNWSLPSGQILGYSRKPGPYTVKGGRNESTSEISENSLVLEYDFSEGKEWVSIVCSIAGTGGMDLSKINKLLLSLKHQGYNGDDGNGNAIYSDTASGSVNIFLEIGTLDEDSDGDGVFDSELTISSGGYEFNGPYLTQVGSGRKSAGNGRLDSEDLNRDNLMQTNEQTVLFPSSDVTGSTVLTLPAGGDWQEYTLQIRNLTSAQLAILQQVSAVRITLVKDVSDRGRVMIDKAYFKGSNWDVIRINGSQVKTSSDFNASIISTRENMVYKTNRIFLDYSGTFEDLHGRLSSSEEEKLDEKSLRIQYDLSSTNQRGTVTKVFNSNMDFTVYKKLVLFLLVKERNSDDTNQMFVFRLGNAADRYYEWRIPITSLATLTNALDTGIKRWHRLEFLLNPDDVADKLKVLVNGTDFGTAILSPKRPNLREINRSTIGIDATDAAQPVSGEFWVNEAYLDNAKKRTGSAFSFRGEVSNTDKKMLELFGIPFLGPFSLKWDISKVGLGFRSIGQDNTDYASFDISASGGFTLLKYLKLDFQYSSQTRESDTDVNRLPLSMQYATTNRSYKHSIGYSDPRSFFPTIVHAYSRNVYQGFSHRLDTDSANATNDILIDTWKQQYSESATLALKGRLPLGISHSYTLSDSFFLTDISDMTNSETDSWFTNSTTQGYATYKKREAYTVSLTANRIFRKPGSSFSVSGVLFREAERYDKVVSSAGMRQEFSMLENRGLMECYSDRLGELLSGVGAISSQIEGTNMSLVSRGLTLKADLKRLGPFSLGYSYTKANKDSNFTLSTNGVEIQKNNATTAKSVLSLGVVLPKFIVSSLNFTLKRDFSFVQTYGTQSMDSIWEAFDSGFFKLPFYYLGIFGAGGRHNDMTYVSRLMDAGGQDIVTLRNSFVLGGKFLFPSGILRDLLPDYFTFSLNQYSARQYSTFTQNKNWNLSFGKNIPIKKLGFWIFDEKSSRGKQVQDLIFKMNLGKKYDYNTKVVTDNLGGSMAFAVRWNRNLTFSLSYALTYSFQYQSLYSTDSDYVYMGLGGDTGDGTGDSFGDMEEGENGAAPSITEYPDATKYTHAFKINFVFPTKHKKVWNFLGLKIPMDPLWVHSNEISLTLYSTEYGRGRNGLYTFSEIFERTFLLKLGHSINYDFSKSWNGILYFIFIFEQWRLVNPNADLVGLTEQRFPISFGMQFGLKMQIRF